MCVILTSTDSEYIEFARFVSRASPHRYVSVGTVYIRMLTIHLHRQERRLTLGDGHTLK
jgi:hypothetical protein